MLWRGLVVLLLVVPVPIVLPARAADAQAPSRVAAAEPAVEVPKALDPALEQPWTARFLAPIVVVIGVVVVGAAGSYYILRIRGRYRVV